MINPMNIIGLLKTRNPQELAMSLIKNNNIQDPTITKLVEYANSGDMNNIQQIAEQMFSKQGRDFNKEFSEFMKMFK